MNTKNAAPKARPGELIVVLAKGDAAGEFGVILNRTTGDLCLAIEGFIQGSDGTGHMTGTGVRSLKLSDEAPEDQELALTIPREVFQRRIA